MRPVSRTARRESGCSQAPLPGELELLVLFANPHVEPRHEVCASPEDPRTRAGRAHGASNIRRRVLAPAVKLANERLEQAGEVPLPEHLTPHKLRHTFASLLVALGVDPGSVMDQLGHTDAKFTLTVYRHGMRRDEASKDALRELVGLPDRAAMGSNVVPVQFGAAAGAL